MFVVFLLTFRDKYFLERKEKLESLLYTFLYQKSLILLNHKSTRELIPVKAFLSFLESLYICYVH